MLLRIIHDIANLLLGIVATEGIVVALVDIVALSSPPVFPQFADFLQAAGQAYWQLLPVCPTGYGDSPYQSFSTNAGNPYFIDLDLLCEDGLLLKEEYDTIDWEAPADDINYGVLYEKRYPVLRKAAERFLQNTPADYTEFCEKNSFWLEDYCTFMALKEKNNMLPHSQWSDKSTGDIKVSKALHGKMQFLF